LFRYYLAQRSWLKDGIQAEVDTQSRIFVGSAGVKLSSRAAALGLAIRFGLTKILPICIYECFAADVRWPCEEKKELLNGKS